jgi:hypothetical protein
MHLHHCSSCGGHVSPELAVATALTVQHRKCAERFGVGTQGQPIVMPIDHAARHRPVAAGGFKTAA